MTTEEKERKGAKKERIDRAGVRSEHRSQHSRDKVLHKMSGVKKESQGCWFSRGAPRQMSRYPSLMLICF